MTSKGSKEGPGRWGEGDRGRPEGKGDVPVWEEDETHGRGTWGYGKSNRAGWGGRVTAHEVPGVRNSTRR